MIWLDEFHINKYVKRIDGRQFNRPMKSGQTRMLNKKRIEMIEKIRQRKLESIILTDRGFAT